jgi:hypothetical protein
MTEDHPITPPQWLSNAWRKLALATGKDPLWASDTYRQRADTRAYLLAIATELESFNG